MNVFIFEIATDLAVCAIRLAALTLMVGGATV